jgi:hypothetical protein
MRVADQIPKCVCFVGYRMADGTMRLAGTAFFVVRPIAGTDRSFGYTVTARHVIDGVRSRGLERVYLRLNLAADNSSAWLETPIEQWLFHPHGFEVDVAVLRLAVPESSDHLALPLAALATPEGIAADDIGVGTEVVITGLFVHHFGQARNIPIIRTGNIAAMPLERVNTRIGAIDAYLVECRSIGGLSGSPVFAVPDRLRVTETGEWKVRHTYHLLGFVHGHYDASVSGSDEIVADSTAAEKINVGIAIVVPIQKFVETINGAAFRELEVAETERLRFGQSGS